MSAVLGVQRELTEALRQGMEFQKQVMTLTQENADLRVQAERHLSRIRELEREAAEVPALKARIAELERELSERPKLPKTVPVDVSAKSKPTSAHGAGTGYGYGSRCWRWRFWCGKSGGSSEKRWGVVRGLFYDQTKGNAC